MLPLKPDRRPRRKRYLHYFLLGDNRHLVIQKRTGKDIWEQMYEFPLLETDSVRMPSSKLRSDLLGQFGRGQHEAVRVDRQEQSLTHQHIVCSFYKVSPMVSRDNKLPAGCRFELLENLEKFAFPKVIRTFLSQFSIKNPTGIST